MAWEPTQSESWAESLGLAHSQMFALSLRDDFQDAAVLLDGRRSSFAFVSSDDPSAVMRDPSPLAWSWSSHLDTLLAANTRSSELYVRHWRTPHELRRLRMPRSSEEAEAIFTEMSRVPRHGSTKDVVSKMIQAFKHLRARLSSYGADNVDVVKAFTSMLDAVPRPGNRTHADEDITLADIFSMKSEVSDVPEWAIPLARAGVYEAYQLLCTSDSDATVLYPDLLIRHAAGNLFQEAHFELERMEEIQLELWGDREPNPTLRGHRRRDARFTPPELARSLVETAFDEFYGDFPDVITVLDPACGSGVFLQAAARELVRRGYNGRACLVGYDESDVSVEIAKYCVGHAAREASSLGVSCEVDIRLQNSLADGCDWGSPSLVLMNPPFTRWRDMTDDDRNLVNEVLGELAKGHADKSMAFVWKAAQCLESGGVLASVIPSTMLDSTYGTKWRNAILGTGEICTIGRFNGYGYFPGAIVEPAFFVMARRSPRNDPLTVLIAQPDCV